MGRTTTGRVLAALPLCGALAAAGCGTTAGLEDGRAPVILVIQGLTASSDPVGDVITDSGTLPADTMSVGFVARTKNPGDLTQPALQEIIVERYEVTFRRTDGGSATPPGFQRGMNAKVRITPHEAATEQITAVTLELVPSTHKAQPPLSHLIEPGFEPGTGLQNIQVDATIRFFGRTIAGDAVSTSATLGINFANFADGS